jgi:TRAP-type C4-dicarboxylate transport system substrate-binding protein
VSDRPRYLAAGHGYTTDVVRAADRLEALGEEDQQAMTAAAHERALEDRLRTRQATAQEVRRELEHAESRVRYLQRTLKRLARA